MRLRLVATGLFLGILCGGGLASETPPVAAPEELRPWMDKLEADAVRLADGAVTALLPSLPPAGISKLWAPLWEHTTSLPGKGPQAPPPELRREAGGGEIWSMVRQVPEDGRRVELGAMRKPSGLKPLYYCVSGLPSQPGAGFDEARRLVDKFTQGQAKEARELSAHTRLLDARQLTLSTWGGRSVMAPWQNYWLFFADDAPQANWAHPCRYIFVAADLSAIAVQYALTPLELRDAAAGAAPHLKVIDPFEVAPAPRPGAAAPARAPTAIRYDGAVSNCYALIISGGCNLDNNHIRYWGDAAYIYSTLTKKYGYAHDHIITLISDGTDPAIDRSDNTNSPFDLDGDGITDTDGPATAHMVSNAFQQLQTLLRPHHQLFVFFTDHGAPTPDAGEWDVQLNLWNDEVLRDADVKAMTTNLPCPVFFTMEQCYSGGFLNDLDQPNRVIATAAQYNESSWAGDTSPDYDQWCYYWTAAMRGFYPGAMPWEDGAACNGDANGDGYVSFWEAQKFAYDHKYKDDHPMYADHPEGLGKRVFLTMLSANALGMGAYSLSPFYSSQATNVPFPLKVTACNVMGIVMTGCNSRATLCAASETAPISIGQGNIPWDMPLNTYYHDARTQVIYPAQLMGGAQTITTLALHVTTIPGQMLSNWTIRAKHTPLTEYPATYQIWETQNWTTVYQHHQSIISSGPATFVLDVPFEYDGVNSLMLDFSFDNGDYSSEGYCLSTATNSLRSISHSSDSEDGNPLEWASYGPPWPNATNLFPNLYLNPQANSEILITPTNLVGFSGGVWTGMVRVLSAAKDIRLSVHGTNWNWTGESDLFAVRDYVFQMQAGQMASAPGSIILNWQSGTAGTYRILSSTGLSGSYTVLATNLPATPPMNTYTCSTASALRQFYCVQEE